MSFYFFACFFSNWDHVLIQPFYLKSETTFFRNFFSSFLFEAQKCPETCVNCLWDCVTPIFTPLEVQFSKHIFFSKTYSSLIWNAKPVPKVTFERYQGEESRIWKIRRLTNQNFEKSERVHCILGKIGWQSFLHGQMNLDIMIISMLIETKYSCY